MSEKNNQERMEEPHEESFARLNVEEKEDLEELEILLITWNLMGTLPSEAAVAQLLADQRIGNSHLIVIGTQECQRTLFASFFYESKDKWESLLETHLNIRGYIKVETNVLQGLHLIVFAHSKKYLYLKDKRKNTIRTGFCNMVGNKGGVSVEVVINGTKLTFVNVHLAANQEETEHRNISLLQVIERLLPSQKESGIGFIFGDMNYRVNISASEAKRFNQKGIDFKEYLKKDQMESQGEQLQPFKRRFAEGEIEFPPTYKVKLDQNQYVSSRIPGWTDRIFYNKSSKLKLASYNSDIEIFGSDHRPVIGRFLLSVERPPESIGEIEVRPASRCLIF